MSGVVPVVQADREAAERRGWSIAHGRWPEPPHIAVHRDYDASYEGPEDGWVDNGLMATAQSLPELLDEIEAIEAEHPHFLEQVES